MNSLLMVRLTSGQQLLAKVIEDATENDFISVEDARVIQPVTNADRSQITVNFLPAFFGAGKQARISRAAIQMRALQIDAALIRAYQQATTGLVIPK